MTQLLFDLTGEALKALDLEWTDPLALGYLALCLLL
jgi:hypothetical protein